MIVVAEERNPIQNRYTECKFGRQRHENKSKKKKEKTNPKN